MAILEPKPDTVICEGDIVALVTLSELLMARGTEIGLEVSDKELLDFPVQFLDVVITNKELVGKHRSIGDHGFRPWRVPEKTDQGRTAHPVLP
jgi:uncharacterized transporter YbjL